MRTLNDPRQGVAPKSAERHQGQAELALLTRANHDMRSPLSVILGVFELLEDASGLDDGERRYLGLGMKAAEELLTLADALRLYTAMERGLVTLDAVPMDPVAMTRERLQAALDGKNIEMPITSGPEPGLQVVGDPGYLELALTSLTRHAVTCLPEPDDRVDEALSVCAQRLPPGRVALRISLGEPGRDDSEAATTTLDPNPLGQHELAVVNAIRLIEIMGGTVRLGRGKPLLVITLPAEARANPS